MMRKTTAAALVLVLAATLAVTTGCTRVRLQDRPDTMVYTTNDSVPIDGATQLTADIHQGVGELELRSAADATSAIQTVFTFSPSDWEPEMTSSVEGSSAVLHIKQPESSSAPMFGGARNSWVVKLPKNVATDLTLELGVGESKVDLRGIDMTRFSALTGVGATTIDFSGPRTHDVSARIESGVGDLTLRLPRSVGARVTAQSDGIGDFIADGEKVNAAGWVNDAYSGNGPKIDIVLHRGIGDVRIVLVD